MNSCILVLANLPEAAAHTARYAAALGQPLGLRLARQVVVRATSSTSSWRMAREAPRSCQKPSSPRPG